MSRKVVCLGSCRLIQLTDSQSFLFGGAAWLTCDVSIFDLLAVFAICKHPLHKRAGAFPPFRLHMVIMIVSNLKSMQRSLAGEKVVTLLVMEEHQTHWPIDWHSVKSPSVMDVMHTSDDTPSKKELCWITRSCDPEFSTLAVLPFHHILCYTYE